MGVCVGVRDSLVLSVMDRQQGDRCGNPVKGMNLYSALGQFNYNQDSVCWKII